MGLAMVASFRSKDPSTQNGACIVDPKSLSILSLGYNGFPRGCSDDKFPWARKAEKQYDTKYPYVEHAERNAIYNAVRNGIKLDGTHMYIYSEKGYYPCPDCAKGIIQSGIKKVIMGFAIKDDTDVWHWDETFRMFNAVGVEVKVLGGFEASPSSHDSLLMDFRLLNEKTKEMIKKLEENNNG